MLGLHNILGIIETFSERCQIFLLVLFDVDHIFNCFKYWPNLVSTVLLLMYYFFYQFEYTNWFIIDIFFPIFSRLWFFIYYFRVFSLNQCICLIYIFVIPRLSHEPIINLLSKYRFFSWTSFWYCIWCYWFNNLEVLMT